MDKIREFSELASNRSKLVSLSKSFERLSHKLVQDFKQVIMNNGSLDILENTSWRIVNVVLKIDTTLSVNSSDPGTLYQ